MTVVIRYQQVIIQINVHFCSALEQDVVLLDFTYNRNNFCEIAYYISCICSSFSLDLHSQYHRWTSWDSQVVLVV